MTAVLLVYYFTCAMALISAQISTKCTSSGLVTDGKMGVSLFDFCLCVYNLARYSILNFISPRRLSRHIVIQVLMASAAASRCCLKAWCCSEGELRLLYVHARERKHMWLSLGCIAPMHKLLGSGGGGVLIEKEEPLVAMKYEYYITWK